MGNGINLGETVPDFTADTNIGPLTWHEYIKDSWAVLFSHPGDFTPVCTTELGEVANLYHEFQSRQLKVAALSCNDADLHREWIRDIEAYSSGSRVDYPIFADPKRQIAVLYGMLDPAEVDKAGLPLTARAVFVIGPDKKLKLSLLYPATTGRNFKEILRAIDSLQLTAKHSVATPVNWQPGDEVMITPNLTNAEAKQKFPKGFTTAQVPSGKTYLRLTLQPGSG